MCRYKKKRTKKDTYFGLKKCFIKIKYKNEKIKRQQLINREIVKKKAPAQKNWTEVNYKIYI